MMPAGSTRKQDAPMWLVWVLLAISLLTIAGVIWLDILGCGIIFPLSPTSLAVFGILLGGIGFAVLGALLVVHQPDNRISWLIAAIGAVQFVPLLANYTSCGLSGAADLPGLPFTYWLTQPLSTLYFFLLFVLLPLVFPNGRFLSRRWRNVTLVLIAIRFVGEVLRSVLPGRMTDTSFGLRTPPFDNPMGLTFLPAEKLRPFLEAPAWIIPILMVLAAISMFVRWRRAKGDEQEQLKWLIYFVSTAFLVNLIFFQLLPYYFYPWIVDTVWYGLNIVVVFVGFPTVIGIAIFKYRLYDIDIIIRRTLSYAALTGVLALVFFGSVVLMQSSFRVLAGDPDSPLITVVSTLAIAALFNPLRIRIQDFIDRRFYRSRYDAEQALAQFAEAARDEVDLEELEDSLHSVVEKTVKPKRVSLWLAATWEDSIQ